jgi:hypothetical protein
MTTEAAPAQGDKVVATLRKPEALESLQAKYPADYNIPLDHLIG